MEVDLIVPTDWQARPIDHAVNRYANRTKDIVYYSLRGHSEAVRHAYEQWPQLYEEPHPVQPGWLHGLSDNLLRAIALTLNGHWQTDVVEWLSEARAFSAREAADFKAFRKDASPEAVDKHLAKERGCRISSFPEYPALVELHLVANAVRHGPGASLTKLWMKHPELWRGHHEFIRLRPWYLSEDEPTNHFAVSEDDIGRYERAVTMFWTRIASAGLGGR